MAHSYTPTYYSSLHDSITSICKTILPFSFKKKRLPAIAAAEQLLAKQQSDNLKWQQESFHQIHNLMGLCKEGILHADEVSAFRSHLLETLIASPLDYEPPQILRDKLIFLQELLYANCISEDEYHASKRPLLQRLAVQGAEIKETDVVVSGTVNNKIANEEWSVINLKEEKCLVNAESLRSTSEPEECSVALKKTKGASSVLSFVTPNKYGKLKEIKDACDFDTKNARMKDRNVGNELLSSNENPFWNASLNEKEGESKSIFLMESLPEVACQKQIGSEKGKRKPFRSIFGRELKEEHDGGEDQALNNKENGKLVKKTWGFDGFKKWKKNGVEDETTPLSLSDKSDCPSYNGGIGNEPDSKKIKKKSHPAGFLLDEGFKENIKKELSRIQTELSARSPPNAHFSDERIEADNNEPKKFCPKSWSDRNGEEPVLDVKKELKDPSLVREKNNSKRWTTFDDDENSHPNLFAPQEQQPYSMKQSRRRRLSSSRTSHTSFNNSSSIDKGFKYNPFFDMM